MCQPLSITLTNVSYQLKNGHIRHIKQNGWRQHFQRDECACILVTCSLNTFLWDTIMTINLFQNTFSPNGEQPDHRELAHNN